MLDALEQRIADLLRSHGANDTQIEMYLDDMFAFSDRELYENADDETILNDFDEWLEK
jgi:hypothetical protein